MISAPTRKAFASLAQGGREFLALRWFRVLLYLVGAALVLRLGLGLLLSRAIDLAIEPRGLACNWEALDLSILSGRGEVRYLSLSAREDGSAGRGKKAAPFAVIEYADFDVELLPLFVGKLRIRRLEIDGMQVLLERAGDGTWNVERHLPGRSAPEPPRDEAPAPAAAETGPLDLAPPASIEALRLQDVSIRLVDHTFADTVERDFHVDAGITDFFNPQRRTRFSATLTGDRVLDGAHVEGDALWTSEKIALELRAQLGGLRPRQLAPWLEPLGVAPSCDSIQGRLAAHVDVGVTGKARDALRLQATVSDVVLSADGVEALALDRLVVDVDSLSRRGASLPRFEVSGVRAHASVEPSQALRFAGLDLSTQAPEEGRGSWLDSLGDAFQLALGDHVPPWAALLVRDDPRAYPWSLARFALTGGEVQLVDHRVDPPAEFPIHVDLIEARDVVHERSTVARPIPVRVEVRVPGTAETVRIDGHVAPFVPERNIDLAAQVDGITLEALKGYLRSAGLESTIERGGLRFHLTGEATTDPRGVTDGWLELEESLAMEGRETSQLGRVRARDLHFDPPARSMRLGNIEVAGTQIVFGRDPSRRLVALGMRTLGLGARPSRASRVPPRAKTGLAARPAAAEAQLPLVEIGRFAWTDSHLAFVDESFDPPRRLTVDPMGFELTGLTLGGPPGLPDPPPARFLARAVAPGIFDELKLEGSVRSKLGGVDLAADLELSGTGLHGALVAPYLAEIGFEPAIADGRAALEIHAELLRHDGWRGSLHLAKGDVSDAGSTIAALEELRLDDVVASGTGLSIGKLAIVAPFARIERARNSGVRAGGLRLAGPRPTGSGAASAPPRLAYPELPPIVVREAVLSDARVAWKDENFEPAVESELRVDASASDLGTTGIPGKASVHFQIPGSIDALDVSSDVVLGPTGLRLGAWVHGSGIRAGALARMLPPGTSFECEDGRFELALAAEIGPAKDDGLRARFEATDVSWRNGDAEAWLACRRALLEVPRVDPAAGVLEVGPIAIEGLSVQAARDAKGALRALGLRIAEAPFEPSAEPRGEPPPETKAAAPIWSKIALAGDVRVGLDRFVLRDAGLGPDARAIEGSVVLRVDGPRTLLGGAPQDLAPVPWSVEGSLRGIVDRWRVEGELSPFADEPGLQASLSASGVRTQGLMEAVPTLAQSLHGDVEQGTLEGKLDLKLAVRRSGPADLGFGRPFGADLRLEGLAYRSEPQGEVLAGIESVAADVDKIDLAKQVVHVKTLEIARPRVLVRRTATALSVFGLAFDLTPRESPVAGTASPEATAVVEAAAPLPRKPAPSGTGADASELRVERFLVSGIAGGIRDERSQPARILPLAALDVEARAITTRALREHMPIRLHAVLTGGPPGPAAAQDGAAGKQPAPWFDELALSGDVALRPEPSGWVRLSLTGLELPEVAALAPAQEVSVREGALDMRTHVKVEGSSAARVQTTLVFTDLSVEEPKGGPIEKGLSLPVTLDAALFLLRNPAGEHRMSVGFTVDEHGLGGGQIALAATEAAAQVLGVALAGAPLRLISALVPQGKGKARGPRAVAEIPFAAGSCELPPDLESKLLSMRRELAGNRSLEILVRHELGAGDRAQAEQLANPPAGECRGLVVRGRQRKAELLRTRAEAAMRARALLAVGNREARSACESLQAIDRELATVEEDLDRVLDVLRTPSERQARKRTRVAALEIAQTRLDVVAEQLRAGLEPEDFDRIEKRDPRFEVRENGGGGRVVLELRER